MLRVKNSLGSTALVDKNLDGKMSFKSMKNWDREQKTPLFSNLAGRVHRQEPLKERINQVIYKLKVNQNRLEGANLKTQQHDKALFDKCVQAQVSKDSARATMYANEISEIRKMAKVTLRSELALEQVVLRLETIEEFGDVASLMGPVAGVVRSIKDQITGVIPQVGYELGEISETLNGVVLEVGEANTIAETRMRERFPELPAGSPAATAELTIPR